MVPRYVVKCDVSVSALDELYIENCRPWIKQIILFIGSFQTWVEQKAGLPAPLLRQEGFSNRCHIPSETFPEYPIPYSQLSLSPLPALFFSTAFITNWHASYFVLFLLPAFCSLGWKPYQQRLCLSWSLLCPKHLESSLPGHWEEIVILCAVNAYYPWLWFALYAFCLTTR